MINRKNNNSHIEPWRVKTIYILLTLVLSYYVIRLIDLQIINNEPYVTQAEDNRTIEISVPTQRGIIYDRNGVVLARNAAAYNVIITPAELPGDPTLVPLPGSIQEIYRELSEVIDIPVTRGVLNEETVRFFTPCQTDFGITEVVVIADTNAPYTPVRIACDIDQKTAMFIQSKSSDWPGVGIEVEAIREYPTGETTAEIVGFLGPIPAVLEQEYRDLGFVPDRDKVGYAGVEASLNEELSGHNGLRVVEVDVAGQQLRDLEPPIPPTPGQDIYLTIDARLQAAAKTALIGDIDLWTRYFNEIRSSNGAVIVMNPKTGEILALVSYPTFENNRMARFIPAYYYEQLSQDLSRPLFNHAISAELPPGSVFKTVTAIGALNEGVITANRSLECPSEGRITITDRYSPNDPGAAKDYVCYDPQGHGRVSYARGIALSCNIYFYKIAGGYQDELPEGLGIWRIGEYARALGYGKVSGIELPGEEDGLVPDPTWKRINLSENWATGDTYIAGVGQGYVLVTPLQVLISSSIIANNGKYMQPTLVKEIYNSEGELVKPFEPKMVYDLTVDPMITVYDENQIPTDEKITIDPAVFRETQMGMRMVVSELEGTVNRYFEGFPIPVAGKTGTGEFCDAIALAKNRCQPGNWPTHAWFVGYAPYDDPEIAVVAFVYNGGEGASVAGPIVRKVMNAYFGLKDIDEGVAQTALAEEVE